MKIYTKGGDKGHTSLFNGKRVRKDDALVEAYGTVDELNSVLGLARGIHAQADSFDSILDALQSQLLELGATLACGNPNAAPRISDNDIRQLELWIDQLQGGLTPLTSFILPGGHATAGALHVARTVCRRAERAAVAVQDLQMFDPIAIRYLNRLADLLFVLAREANRLHAVDDIKWQKKDASQ